MKIVIVSAARVPSDTANSIQVMKVCQAFAQLGHEAILLVPGPAPTFNDLKQHYGLTTLFQVEWLPTRDRRMFPWRAVWRARALGADLLYAWPIQSAWLSPLLGIPSMLEMHDYPAGSFGPLWYRLFLRLPGKKRLLPITEALYSALKEKYGPMPGGRLVISPDGVDLERYTALPGPVEARRACLLPELPTILCTGHLYKGRGADLFLALAEKLPKAGFVWVGGRPEDVKNWQSQATGKKLANVTFTGFITNDRIPLYQAAADILLMPYGRSISGSSGGDISSVYSPMKMFEYMAAGRAILSSDLPVLREVIDESMAVFCPAEDVGAWTDALGSLLSDPQRRLALGERARAAASKYSWIERARRALQSFNE
jgi:glycosyltransferase involved in cell wall biosynthesis